MLSIEQLFTEHAAIGKTVSAAKKSIMPITTMNLAKQAADDSHVLLGGILEQVKDLDRRVSALEERIS